MQKYDSYNFEDHGFEGNYLNPPEIRLLKISVGNTEVVRFVKYPPATMALHYVVDPESQLGQYLLCATTKENPCVLCLCEYTCKEHKLYLAQEMGTLTMSALRVSSQNQAGSLKEALDEGFQNIRSQHQQIDHWGFWITRPNRFNYKARVAPLAEEQICEGNLRVEAFFGDYQDENPFATLFKELAPHELLARVPGLKNKLKLKYPGHPLLTQSPVVPQNLEEALAAAPRPIINSLGDKISAPKITTTED